MNHGTLENGTKKILVELNNDPNNSHTFYAGSLQEIVSDLLTICTLGHCKGVHDINNFYKNMHKFTAYCGEEKIVWNRFNK